MADETRPDKGTTLPPPTTTAVTLIDDAYAAKARNGDGAGIAMSQVIHPCDRAIWMAFRWAAPQEAATGKGERIFETGNLYERRLLDMLRMIGCDVQEIDETTGTQFRVELANGHVRGKMDGIVTNYPGEPETQFVFECKSANDKNYKVIVKGPIKETKTEHYAQLQLYLHASGLRHGLYAVVNKNTDEIHFERVAYDPTFCLAIVSRLERIAALSVVPVRLHDDPTSKSARECGWCPSRSICHEGAFARVNCRTCLAVTPQDGPKWHCERHDRVLTYSDQQDGCADHLFLPSIVPGVQVDADEEAGTITYRLADGAIWVDGGEVAA